MPSKWSVGVRSGTGDWMVMRDGTQHGRAHAKQEQAVAAMKNFEMEERKKEAAEQAAKKKQGG